MPASKDKCASVYSEIKQEMALLGHKVDTKWIKAAMTTMERQPEVWEALVKVLKQVWGATQKESK